MAQTDQTGVTGPELDTEDWFDSKIPPAAQQPEAMDLRPSDSDPESLAAHMGLPDDQPPVPPDFGKPPTQP
jgi:hypothetical protein